MAEALPSALPASSRASHRHFPEELWAKHPELLFALLAKESTARDGCWEHRSTGRAALAAARALAGPGGYPRISALRGAAGPTLLRDLPCFAPPPLQRNVGNGIIVLFLQRDKCPDFSAGRSQNSRLIWGGKDLKAHLIPAPATGSDSSH